MNARLEADIFGGKRPDKQRFPLDRWYVAALSWELTDRPLARTLLNEPIVLYRKKDGGVAALEDRCCHRMLPLSSGTIEEGGLRCGYHGLLYGCDGRCIEIPGQQHISPKARVKSYTVVEKDQIIWIWFGSQSGMSPTLSAPSNKPNSDPRYVVAGDLYRYQAPYQLIHDNLLDLSHLGYVHGRTIGGNASLHMETGTDVTKVGDSILVRRLMPDSVPPPTYQDGWAFSGRIDRWQEIEFHVTYITIWTGAVPTGTESITAPERGGFHMRGFHGITPETESTTHYFWTMAANSHPDRPDGPKSAMEQTARTFDEDKIIIEAQWANMQKFGGAPTVNIHVDVAPIRARRIVDRLASTAIGDA